MVSSGASISENPDALISVTLAVGATPGPGTAPAVTIVPIPSAASSLATIQLTGVVISPGGNNTISAIGANDRLRVSDEDIEIPEVAIGGAVLRARQNVYVAQLDAGCNQSVAIAAQQQQNEQPRRYVVSCQRVVIDGFIAGGGNVTPNSVTTFMSVTVHKAQLPTRRVCYQAGSEPVNCRLTLTNPGVPNDHIIVLAFPKQTYRGDDGKCQSAPFYAVGNCQRENVVNVGGNFAAFVSGLDGNGYRQFGVMHRVEMDEWQLAGLVSHARGGAFADTWWAKMRAEHPLFDGAGGMRGFAEYESGITSLRQNDVLFENVPVSGGRLGFGNDDFTASFGRPMHFKGKGDNSASLRWLMNKETTLGVIQSGNDTEATIEWRRQL